MSRRGLMVGQSGGPTAVINSSLYGIISEGLHDSESRFLCEYEASGKAIPPTAYPAV